MQKRAVAPGRLLLARMIALVVACAFAAGLPGPAQAQRMAHLPAVAPVLSCADLARTDLAAATGATATLSAAAVDGPYFAMRAALDAGAGTPLARFAAGRRGPLMFRRAIGLLEVVGQSRARRQNQCQ